MSVDLSPAAYDVARVGLLDELDAAREKLLQASLDAAMPGGDDAGMVEAEDEVRRIQQKLQGLSYGQKRAEAEQAKRDAADRAARRRASAVDILALVYKRYSATVALDSAISAVGDAKQRVELLGDELVLEASGWFDGGNQGQQNLRNFLMSVAAYDMTDTIYKFNTDVGRLRSYSDGLPLTQPMALRALAKAIPEVDDEAVKEEAKARAEAERGTPLEKGYPHV